MFNPHTKDSTESSKRKGYDFFNTIRRSIPGKKHDDKNQSSKQDGTPDNKNNQLYNIIYAKVTKKNHKHKSPQEGDGTLKKCIELFKEGAKPDVLNDVLIELEKLPEGQEYLEYYTQYFLPALAKEIESSQKLKQKDKEVILKTIFSITPKDSERDLSATPNQNDHRNSQADNVKTLKLNNGSDSDSGISSLNPSKEDSKSPVSSRRNSVSSISSSVEGNDNLQKEEIEQPKQNPEENPGDRADPDQVKEKSAQVLPQYVTEGEGSKSPVPATLMTDDDYIKDPVKPEEKKNAIVQKPSANRNNSKDISPKKQSNNRSLYIAFAVGCALSTIGCIAAGAMTSGLMEAGLFAVAAVFAITTAVTWYLTPSSKLASTNLSRPVDSLQHVHICKN